MEEPLSNLKRAMDDTVYKGTHFSEEDKVTIRRAIKHPHNKKRAEWLPKVLTVTLFIGCILFITDLSTKNSPPSDPPSQGEQGTGTTTEEQQNKEANLVQKTAVEKVLGHQFTGPDEEFKELNHKEAIQELGKYYTEVYGPYFTDSGLDSFLGAFGTQYPTLAYFNGYQLSLKKITMEQWEKSANRYTFVATVGYQKDGEEEKTADVEGEVLFSTKEEGKIEGFRYMNDNGLSDFLRTSN